MTSIGSLSPEELIKRLTQWGCSSNEAEQLTEILKIEKHAIRILLRGEAREKGKPPVHVAHANQMHDALKAIESLENALFPPGGDNGLVVRLDAALDLDAIEILRRKIEQNVQ